MKRRGIIDNLRDVRRGLAQGIAEFIRSSQEVQEDLGLEPIPEEDIRTILRAVISLALFLIYTVGIVLLARWFSAAPILVAGAATGSALLTLRLLRSIWAAG